jgi:hypothetical protein
LGLPKNVLNGLEYIGFIINNQNMFTRQVGRLGHGIVLHVVSIGPRAPLNWKNSRLKCQGADASEMPVTDP